MNINVKDLRCDGGRVVLLTSLSCHYELYYFTGVTVFCIDQIIVKTNAELFVV